MLLQFYSLSTRLPAIPQGPLGVKLEVSMTLPRRVMSDAFVGSAVITGLGSPGKLEMT